MERSEIKMLFVCAFVLLLCGQVFGDGWNTVVFRDDFEVPGDTPDLNDWVVGHPEAWPGCWWTQGRTFFPDPCCHPDANFPRVDNGICVIEHHHYNPWHLGTPKTTFLGGEIQTVMQFEPNKPYRFEARVRCNPYPNGLVSSFFTYGYDGSKNDEIDFEFVSNKTNDDVNYPNGDPVLTNPWNESHECPNYVEPPGLDLTEWNTFRIYWYPGQHRVEWTWIDPVNGEKLLRRETGVACVPDEPMAVYFNFWAPKPDWPDAYDANLQPVSDPNMNEIYRYEIDYVEVRVKGPVPHLKWSQPPIPIDPNEDFPTYCGWDEPSYTIPDYDWYGVADDFRCLGTMPIESIHWWGSHPGWDNPEVMPPNLPIGWRFGFWSNDASTQRCDFLYGSDGTDLYRIDPSTGAATLIGPIGFPRVTGLSFAPDGTLYGSCREWLWALPLLITIDTMTGAGTAVGLIDPTGMQRAVPGISFRADGVLYGYGKNPNQLITINTATGQGTVVGATGYSGQGNGMDFAPNGTLYATPSDNLSLVIINPATGVGSDVAGTVGNVPLRVNALEFCDSTGVLFGSWNDDIPGSGLWYLVTLDLTTGLPTVIGPTVDWLDALAFHEISQPKELLKVIEVDEDRVTVDQVGWDYYYDFYPSDICYQYYVDLEPNEVFWQNEYLDHTEDEIFWLSITAIYDPCLTSVDNAWGWKTRPWSWMDDAVRFWLYDDPEVGMVLDPWFVEPIEDPEFHESFDVAFELDTDPNYIKWEQPFTDIRLWPHYEDELSMRWVDHWIEEKWRQDPYPDGWDVAFSTVDPTALVELADDWRCDETGPIDDIHFWVSWEGDFIGWIPWITVRIYTDNPVGPGGYSEPNELKWERTFRPPEFNMWWYYASEPGFFEPVTGIWDWPNHLEYFQIDINDIKDPFIQEQGNIYWLSIEANSVDGWVGWKTSQMLWNDKAVYRHPSTGEWFELYDPMQPVPVSLDLAFVLTTKKSELYIDRLVADDWPCDYNTPITATVWWGSYIDYGYEACGMSWMPLPVKPDYFLLNIWDDVPAGVDLQYSHPNEIIWEYRAYDYGEVLVGYDKHPHGEPNEAVFRYSVRIPHDEWFLQDKPNDVYWFSVVAVYDDNVPNYDWGWTNHKHVYNDDAVAGVLIVNGGPEWQWDELYDQTGAS
ncbi:MAG: DUF7901 domain-containing protein, partial [Planctomycetota bacterium]